MTRVSLTEDYDDRSVISKLNEMDKRIKENASVVTSAEESARQSAQSAQETADRFAGSVGAVVQNANQQINASKAQVDQAKAEVDETVTTVAQAVTTANQASASAQASAQTVAGYGTRLTAVEDKAQGNKASIDHLEIETRDLYDRDANNVKLHADYQQNVAGPIAFNGDFTLQRQTPSIEFVANTNYTQGTLAFTRVGFPRAVNASLNPDGMRNEILIPSNANSKRFVDKAYVSATDGTTNNLVHTLGDEYKDGALILRNGYRDFCVFGAISGTHTDDKWYKVGTFNRVNGNSFQLEVTAYTNDGYGGHCHLSMGSSETYTHIGVLDWGSYDPAFLPRNGFILTRDSEGLCTLWLQDHRYRYVDVEGIAHNWNGRRRLTAYFTFGDSTELFDIPKAEDYEFFQRTV